MEALKIIGGILLVLLIAEVSRPYRLRYEAWVKSRFQPRLEATARKFDELVATYPDSPNVERWRAAARDLRR